MLFHMSKRIVLGPAVRAIREAYGIKHGEFAIRCLISPGYLSNIEKSVGTDHGKQPSPAVAVSIAQQLGVPLDAISYVEKDCQTCAQDLAA